MFKLLSITAFLVSLAAKVLPVVLPAIGAALGIRLIGGKKAIKSVVAGATGSELTGAQIDQNEWAAQEAETNRIFNAEQAEVNRAFQAEQAQIGRDFQMEMDSTKYQRSVADMRAAGVNPMLMMGGQSVSASGGSSVPSGSAATGTPASGSLGAATSMSELMSLITLPMQLKLMEAQVDKTKAESNKVEVEAQESKSRAELNLANLPWIDKLNEAQVRDVESAVGRREVQNLLDEQGISESQAREAFTVNQAILAAIDAESRGRLNDLAVQLREAEVALTEARTSSEYQGVAESKARIRRISAEIDELYQRSITHAAHAGYFDSMTWNNLVGMIS